jgi:FtsH ternary system domain X6
MSDDDEEDFEDFSEDVEEIEEIPQVAASESDMIMMARALIAGPSGHDDIWALLCATRPLPPKIGPTSARIIEDTLRHAWRALWLRGGAKPAMTVRGGGSVKGRLWERHEPIPLAFTQSTIKLLRWLVATPFAAPASTLTELPAAPLSVGDQLMVYFALDAARTTPALRGIAIQPFVRACPLAWLGFAPLLVARNAKVPAFDSLVEGVGALVVEALTGELAKRWYGAELGKRAITDPQELIDLGATQETVLKELMLAADKRGRRDLAAFVIDAAIPLINRNLSPAPAELDSKAPLSTRAQARTAAGSLLRAVLRWQDWDQEHRGVRFIDDNYQAAQLLLERYEPIGSAGSGRVSGWLADLASLAPTAPAADTIIEGTTT